MRHLGTQVTHPGETPFRSCGQTMWVAEAPDAELGLAWDWVDIGYGVVAMADPLAVVTNLRLVDGDEVLAPLESARHISGLVNALPWQEEVARALHRHAVQ